MQNNPPTTAEDTARQTIEQAQAARVQACGAEIAESLKKHNCKLTPLGVIRETGVTLQIKLEASC